MTNFSVNFVNAWWLLLLIPAIGLTLFSYFSVNKRYRCTRNRVVSAVLHLIIMVLSIALLAGLTVDFFIPDTENEVILLVDSSYTMDENKKESDKFIKEVINGSDSMYQLGIVKFGYDQVYAVELTDDMSKVYSTYQSSKDPDISATDIASALSYAAGLFEKPETARIVLISDALATDGSANDVVKSFAGKIAVDVVHFSNEGGEKTEVQIVSAVPSELKVEAKSKFNMNVTVYSTVSCQASITPYDNNQKGQTIENISLEPGRQTISIPYTFITGGMHVVSFEIKTSTDTIVQNNTYHSYIYIETFGEVLVIESIEGESKNLYNMLQVGEDADPSEKFNVTVVNVNDSSKMPKTLEQLRKYDEIILLNIANKDLPEGFDKILKQYVHDIGGGLFTVCGNEKDSSDKDWTAHAYTVEDMYKTTYQEMLPVEIVEYTPPVGVVIIIDSSGSMLGSNYENTKFKFALEGAKACLDALEERDYVAIMTLADSYTEELPLTPCPQRDVIYASIELLEEQAKKGTIVSGGTLFSPALARAKTTLAARSDLEKKHIIIVTDGEPSQSDYDDYMIAAKELKAAKITMSIVGAGIDPNNIPVQDKMVELLSAAGCDAEKYHPVREGDYSAIPKAMRNDLETPEIKSVNYEDFIPKINAYNSITNKIDPTKIPTLGGYYGVKLKDGATAVLMGNYSPIYSQWEYGKGRVGTFTCNLDGSAWSAEFVASDVGKELIQNIVRYLFPKESVRPKDIGVSLSGDNYTNNLSIFTELGETESIKVTVTAPDGESQVFNLNHDTGYTRLTFATKLPGLHTVTVQKLDESGKETANPTTIYKALAYSKEYDALADKDAAKLLAESLVSSTGGDMIEDADEVFENAVEYLHVVIDPRIPFAIIIIVLFLLDIAARKFKWKWPSEIWRERKRAKEQSGKGGVK